MGRIIEMDLEQFKKYSTQYNETTYIAEKPEHACAKKEPTPNKRVGRRVVGCRQRLAHLTPMNVFPRLEHPQVHPQTVYTSEM